MSFLNSSNHAKKFFVVSMVILITFFSLPSKTNAQYLTFDVPAEISTGVSAVSNPITATMTTLEKIKFYVLDPLAWSLAKRMIDRLTVQTVNWINSGFDGNSFYLGSPGQFFLDTADNTASKFLSSTALNQLCTPFKAEVRLALLKTYISSTNLNESYTCSLGEIANNYKQFTENFNEGGWDSWFTITQNDANNPYGAYINAQESFLRTIGAEQNKFKQQLEQGQGFLSFQQCPKEKTVTAAQASQWNSDIDYEISIGNINSADDVGGYWKAGDCNGEKITTTPGKVIADQLENSLGSGVRQLELADSFQEILSALTTQLVKKLNGGANGENGLRNVGTTDPEFVAPPAENDEEPMIIFPNGNPIYIKVGLKASELASNLKAVAVDAKDGDISNKIIRTGSVNSNVMGTYTPTYRVTNSKGITKAETLTVIVNATGVPPNTDTTPPDDGTVTPPPIPPVTCTPTEGGGLICTVPTTPTPPTVPGNGGSCTPGGIGNDPGAPTTINESQIVWGDADIGSWPVTSNLSSVTANASSIDLSYSTAGSWPNVYFSMFNGDPVIGNAWVVAWRNGAWRASTFEWLRPGQTSKGLDNLIGADGTLASPLGNFTPKIGETYGFVVSTPARGGNRGSVNERSNVYTMVWNGGVCTPGSGSTTGPACATSGNSYGSVVQAASQSVLNDNPTLANAMNTTANARQFQTLLEAEIRARGYNASASVLNGNNNPNNGDLIAIWMNGATTMERYDVIIGVGDGTATMRNSISNNFVGFIPLTCTSTGGGTNCGCTGGTTNPPPVTPPPSNNPARPNIISITPTSVTPGATVITINGTNLRNASTGAVNVVFLTSAGRSTVAAGASTDSGGTQTTVTVPAGLSGSSVAVFLDNGTNLVSNSVTLQMGTPITNVTTPTSTIRPQVSANGWWPHISPNGRYLAYGDWGGSWVYDRTTGSTYNFSTPPDLASDPSRICIGGFWITPTRLTYVCMSDSLPRDHAYRYEVDFSGTTPGTPTRTNDDPAILAGNQFMAEDGHWASWMTLGFRLAKDNAVVATGVGGAVAISGNQIVHACDNSNTSICLRTGTALTRTYPALAPLHQMTITDGYIMYGAYGGLRGITPTGLDLNLKLSSSYIEGAGNAPGVRTGAGGQIIKYGNLYWIATVASGAGGNYIFLRPWGATTAIVVQANAVSLDVAISGTDFVIGYNDDRGAMAIITVPINSPRIAIP